MSCHNGPLMSNHAFQNIAAPQIFNIGSNFSEDLGRAEVFSNPRFRFTFKTMPLRNIALTAPYTHSGSLLNLEEVVRHYNDIPQSLNDYSVDGVNLSFDQFFNESFFYEERGNEEKLRRLPPMLRSPLNLNEREIKDLVCFLSRSLTQKRFSNLEHIKRDCSE